MWKTTGFSAIEWPLAKSRFVARASRCSLSVSSSLCFGLWTIAGIAPGLDHQLSANVVSHRARWVTSAAHAFSALGRSWVVIPATLIFGLALTPRLIWRAFGPLVAALGTPQLQAIIKWLVQRPRPYTYLQPGSRERPGLVDRSSADDYLRALKPSLVGIRLCVETAAKQTASSDLRQELVGCALFVERLVK